MDTNATITLASASRSGAICWFGEDPDDEPPRATESGRAETDDRTPPDEPTDREGGRSDAEAAEPNGAGCACDWPTWAAPCPDHPRELADIDSLAELQAGYAHAPRTATADGPRFSIEPIREPARMWPAPKDGPPAAELLELLEHDPPPSPDERELIERLAAAAGFFAPTVTITATDAGEPDGPTVIEHRDGGGRLLCIERIEAWGEPGPAIKIEVGGIEPGQPAPAMFDGGS